MHGCLIESNYGILARQIDIWNATVEFDLRQWGLMRHDARSQEQAKGIHVPIAHSEATHASHAHNDTNEFIPGTS